MPEVTVFDAYRANRALKGQLEPDDRLDVLACDDISRDYWVLTTKELVVLKHGEITTRIPFKRLQGTVVEGINGVDVRVRDSDRPDLAIATFRHANSVTTRLAALLSEQQ